MMNLYLLPLVLLLFLFVSCNNKESETKKDNTIYHVLSKAYEERNADGPCIQDLYGEWKYGHWNFLLTDSNWVYIHHKYNFNLGGTEITDADKLLPFLNLTPNDFTRVKSEDLSEYLTQNLKDSLIDPVSGKKVRTYVTIGSEVDTIVNPDFKVIVDKLNSFTSKAYFVRVISEEESVVTQYLFKKEPYKPEEITWNTLFRRENKYKKLLDSLQQ